MWARKRIDIGWSDLWFGFRSTLRRGDRAAATAAVESALADRNQTLACLSVRSGFDLLLGVLHLPPGSEVLVSSVTILDMVRIMEAHELVPVPVDLCPDSMQPIAQAARSAVTSKTRAILVAHLFGSILELKELLLVAEEHQLLFIEDCAQAFDGRRYTGDPAADITMFSFGPIKTSTALAGGLLIVRDADLLHKMRAVHSLWPEQPQAEFRMRILSYSWLKFLSGKRAFSVLVRALNWLGHDIEKTLNGAIRNFPAKQFFASLRRQPSTALLRLIHRRVLNFDYARQDRRAKLGHVLGQLVTSSSGKTDQGTDHFTVPSIANHSHTWWVFPLCCTNRHELLGQLRKLGFDAAAGGQLRPVPEPEGHESHAAFQSRQVLESLCFLPLYPEMTDEAVEQLGKAVKDFLVKNP